jgi:plasmid stabilization system protein ParE
VTTYRLVVEPDAEEDVRAAFEWYNGERAGLGQESLNELTATFDRVREGPFTYQILRARTRHALLRRFPYAVYFSVVGDDVIVTTVLHSGRDPAIRQRRRR